MGPREQLHTPETPEDKRFQYARNLHNSSTDYLQHLSHDLEGQITRHSNMIRDYKQDLKSPTETEGDLDLLKTRIAKLEGYIEENSWQLGIVRDRIREKKGK